MTNIPTICDVEELLVLLRENAHTRAVTYMNGEVAVCECADGDPAFPIRPVAWIENMGTARDLLNKAYKADGSRDRFAWATLPLKYGPYCSTWVLPEHPKAPAKPGPDW
jgi:hypothetical protein